MSADYTTRAYSAEIICVYENTNDLQDG